MADHYDKGAQSTSAADDYVDTSSKRKNYRQFGKLPAAPHSNPLFPYARAALGISAAKLNSRSYVDDVPVTLQIVS